MSKVYIIIDPTGREIGGIYTTKELALKRMAYLYKEAVGAWERYSKFNTFNRFPHPRIYNQGTRITTLYGEIEIETEILTSPDEAKTQSWFGSIKDSSFPRTCSECGNIEAKDGDFYCTFHCEYMRCADRGTCAGFIEKKGGGE